MKRLNKILYIFGLSLFCVFSGYFIHSCNRMNANIDILVFKHQYFRTKDDRSFISFGSFKNTVLSIDERLIFITSLEYENGIFTMLDEEKIYYFGVIDENTIYNSTYNLYFYNIEVLKNE